MSDFDSIVIGSGFGGAVMACRLAEKGARVLVLERGRRWKPEDYPSVSQKHWLWDEDEPERQNGWLDFRYFGDMSVAQGAGVAGEASQRAREHVDVLEVVVGQLRDDPLAVGAVGRQREVDLVELLDHGGTLRGRTNHAAARTCGTSYSDRRPGAATSPFPAPHPSGEAH